MSLRRLERVYCLLVALRWLPVGLWFPLMVLVQRDRGLSLGEVGLVGAVYTATVLGLELPTGGLADVLGRRKVLLASSVLTFAQLGTFLVADGIAAFALVSLLHGTARALSSGPLEAWFVDAALRADPDADLTRGLARGAVADGASLALGALAAGLLPALAPALPQGAGAPLSQLTLPAAVAILAEAVHLLAVLTLMREPPSGEKTAGTRPLRALATVAREGTRLAGTSTVIRRLLLVMAAVGLSIAALELLAAPRVAELLGGTERTEVFGVLWAGGFLAAAFGSALAPLLVRLVGRRVALAALVGRLSEGMSVILLGGVAALVPTVGLYGLAYLLGGMVSPLHRELLHREVPDMQRATMLSVDSLALMVGGLVGGLTLPQLAERAGIGAAWLVGGAVLSASALLYRRPRVGRHDGLSDRTGGAVGAQR